MSNLSIVERPSKASVDWPAVRREFRLDPGWIHLVNFLLASPPRSVRTAAERWRAVLDVNPHLVETFLLGSIDNLGCAIDPASPYFAAKRAMSGYLGANAEDVAFVPNTTTGLALLYNGLSLKPGAEIVVTAGAHYSHRESARRSVEKNGAELRTMDVCRDSAGTGVAEILEQVQASISSRTRAIGMTWVSSCTGLKLPVPQIAAVVANANRDRDEADRCLLIIDGVHGFGVEDVDAASLGADFFIAGAHKWFLGPGGTGIIWGHRDAWAHISPTIPSFEIDPTLHQSWRRNQPLPPTRASYMTPGGFLDYANIFALTDTVQFHQRLTRPAITARIHQLNTQLRYGLAAMPGIRLLTPRTQDLSSAFVCFQIPGHDPTDIVNHLAVHRIRAAASPYRTPTVRIAAGITNTAADITTTLATIHKLQRT